MKKSRLMSIVYTCVLTLCSFTVQAATVSYYDDFWAGNFFFTSAETDNKLDKLRNDENLSGDGSNLSISQFDPTLGELTSIRITVDNILLDKGASATFIDNTWASTVSGRQRFQNVQLNISMPGFGLIYDDPTITDTCSATGGLLSGASCDTEIIQSPSHLSDEIKTLVDPGLLASYIGFGNIPLDVVMSGELWTDETNGDNGFVAYRDGFIVITGDIKVDYNYNPVAPVPLPAATWLFGSGLLGLIGIARKKAA